VPLPGTADVLQRVTVCPTVASVTAPVAVPT